jgi:hypothetical protein
MPIFVCVNAGIEDIAIDEMSVTRISRAKIKALTQ